MLAKHLEKKEQEGGFTLVELLVVILIIGILAAVAIPAFLNQRKRANDAAVESDMKNVAIQIESILVEEPNSDDIEVYTDLSTQEAVIDVEGSRYTAGSGTTPMRVALSDGVVIETQTGAQGANGYVLMGGHTNGDQYKVTVTGSGVTWGTGTPAPYLVYNSAAGGIQ